MTSGLSLGDGTSYFFSRLDCGAKRGAGSLEWNLSLGWRLGLPRAGVGPSISFPMLSVLLPLLEADCSNHKHRGKRVGYPHFVSLSSPL